MSIEFQEKVWNLLKKIPRGKVSTYSELARSLGKPKSVRAIGKVLNKNPNAPKVPCHRIVKSSGELGGYRFGQKKKKFLLESEGIQFNSSNKIVNFEEKLFKF